MARSEPRRNSAGSLVIQGSQRLARIVAIVVSAAVLDPAPFAGLAIALALTDLIRSALLAYDVSAVRLMAGGHDRREVLGSHLGTKLVVGIVGTLAVVGFSAAAYPVETTWLVVIASIGTIPVGISSLFLVRRQVDFALGTAATRVAFGSATGTAVAVAGLVITKQPAAVSAGLAAGDVLTLVLLAAARPEIGRTGLAQIAGVIRGSATLLTMQLAYITQFRVGTVVLGAVGAVVAVGEYTVASRIAEGLVILAAAVTASSLPMMGAAHARSDIEGLERTVRRSYRASLLVAAPVVSILALSGPIWVQLLFPRYPGAAAVYIPVGLTVVVYFASSQTSAFLNASHRDRIAAASAVVGVVAAILGSWWLLGLGAIGVALARLGGELVRLGIETVAMARVARVLTNSMAGAWMSVAPFLLSAGLMGITGWSLPAVALGAGVTVAWGTWLATRSWIELRA